MRLWRWQEQNQTCPFDFRTWLPLPLPSPVACLASLHMSLCYWWPQMLMSQSSLALLSNYLAILSRSHTFFLSLSRSSSVTLASFAKASKFIAHFLSATWAFMRHVCVLCGLCICVLYVCVCMCVLSVCILHSITCNFWPTIVCHCRHRSKTAASLDKRAAVVPRQDQERASPAQHFPHFPRFFQRFSSIAL